MGYAALLYAVPARLIIGPLGGAGTPASVLGMLGTFWWVWNSIEKTRMNPGRARPIRQAMLFFVCVIMASYVVGTSRPIAGVELRSMESGLLTLTAWFGVVLVASDGIPTIPRFQVLIRWLSLLGGLEACLGIIQFITGRPFTDLIQIPGLVSNSAAFDVGDRDGFARPAGTAIHSIEFGVSITALLPLCLYVAMNTDAGSRFRRWFPVFAIAVAIPLSVSRSAIIGTVVVLAFLLPTWSTRGRAMTAAGVLALLAGIFVLVPGFLGAFLKLFTGISGDSSALSRTDSYALAWEFIQRSPIIGRGFLTFLPQYRILDNQYLGTLIDAGFLGLVALVGVFTTAIVLALRVRALTKDPQIRALAQALAASAGSLMIGFAFFDAFSFPMASGTAFLICGLVGALHRLVRERGTREPQGRSGTSPRGKPASSGPVPSRPS